MFCSKCGANVADGAAFCAACGMPIAGYSVGGQAGGAAPPPAGGYAPAAAPGGYAPGYAVARPTVTYAGFWLRFVAFIIDVIVLSLVGWIIFLPFAASVGMGALMRGHPPMGPEEWAPLFAGMFRLMFLRIILNWLYFAILESSAWQGTLGKKALGLQVTDLSGRRISFARATGRFFGKFLSTVILFIGYIMAGFTEKKQALHDILAGTLVVRQL